MSMRSVSLCCGLMSAFLLLLLGCGGGDPLGRKAISGTVTLNGSPVEQGNISFEPDGGGATTSSGSVIKAGKFAMAKDVGLPPGKYRVRVHVPKPGTVMPEDTVTMPGEETPPPAEMAPPEWNTKSTQTIEVKPDGPFEFSFEVISKK